MNDHYLIHCGHCKQKTIHRISKTSRAKGVRLQCFVCANTKARWVNLKSLEGKEYEKSPQA